MKLKRKIFVNSEYYKDLGLNEFEENWLRNKRSELAKKYEKRKKDILNDPKKKLDRPKLLKELREELMKGEKIISGGKVSSKEYEIKEKDPKRISRYIKEAVNSVGEKRKKEEIQAAEILKLKENRIKLRENRIKQVEKLKKLKKQKTLKRVGIGGLIVGGTALGTVGIAKVIKDHNKNRAVKSVKEQILNN